MSRALLGIAGAFGGAATAAMGAAVGYGYMLGSVPRECPHCDGHKLGTDGKLNGTRSKGTSTAITASSAAVDEAQRRQAYDELANTFDDELEWHELFTGIKLMRWWMMGQAKGETLEVAAGTGRNFQYYPADTRLTATDCSSAMVEVCRAKADKEYPATLTKKNQKDDTERHDDESAKDGAIIMNSRGKFAKLDVRVDDAGNMGFKSGTFDTVVDTFGLCSYEDPVAVLREMERVCRKKKSKNKKKKKSNNKIFFGGGEEGDKGNAASVVVVAAGDEDDGDMNDDGGRIFLLEHGRSETHGWLSNILDKFAQPHAAKWGCYWNRDILKIVRDAGLEIVESRTYHFGTTYYIIARPK